MEKSKRIGYVDILKCIGIILIVYGHIYINQISYNLLYSFHVSIFFFIAGFLYKQQPTGKNIKHKFYTTIIPYLIFGFIELLYWQFIEKRFRASELPFQYGLLGLISGKYSLLDFNVHLWFLPAYFSTLVTFDILTKLLGKKWNIVPIIILSLLYIFINPMTELVFGIEKVPQYILFVLNYYNLNKNVMWFVCGVIGVMASFVLAVLLDGKCKIMNEIGKCTLVVLCVHGPLYRIIIKICSIITKTEVDILRGNFIIAMVITIVTIAICYIIYKILDKYLPWTIGKQKRKVRD